MKSILLDILNILDSSLSTVLLCKYSVFKVILSWKDNVCETAVRHSDTVQGCSEVCKMGIFPTLPMGKQCSGKSPRKTVDCYVFICFNWWIKNYILFNLKWHIFICAIDNILSFLSMRYLFSFLQNCYPWKIEKKKTNLGPGIHPGDTN